jgi:hypothetical protein
MSTPAPRNWLWARLGLMAGAAACMIPCFLFGVWGPRFVALTGLKKGAIIVLFLAAMATCAEVSARCRPRLGMLILPICFLGLMSLVCWWIVATN